jgi:hypothetical protein
MSTFEEAKNAARQRDAVVVVHKTITYFETADTRGQLQVKVGIAVTWCPAAIIVTPSTRPEDVPCAQQVLITAAEAEELIRLGARDECDSDESREIERLVAERKKRGR